MQRRGDQLPTTTTTAERVMSSPQFARGVADVRAGRGFPRDYDTWKDKTWSYERGRAWAMTAGSMPLKRNGKLSPEALIHFSWSGDIL